MRVAALSPAILLTLGVTACGGEPPDGPVGTAEQAQIDPGVKDYLVYTISNDAGLQLGQVLVTATAGAGYAANTEYWYMATNLSNSSAVTFTGGTSQYWSSPPTGLGTLSFSMSRTATWSGAFASGTYPVYQNTSTGEYDAMNWQMSNTGGTWTGKIVWWHNSGTNTLFGDGVTRRLAPTAASGFHQSAIVLPL